MNDLVATCAAGTEDLLAKEVEKLKLGKRPLRQAGAVTIAVPAGIDRLAHAARLCVELRTAQRVLLPLARYDAADADALYAGAREIPWEEHLTSRHTFALSATTRAAPPLANSLFILQRVKDAIVDRMRERGGMRPDVDRDDPDVAIYVHVAQKRERGGLATPRVTVGLDAAGQGLHRRGYRLDQTEAPLRETLAAAVVLATGWRGDQPLVDPMCGSGTLVIEAAMYACRVAPGVAAAVRPRYGFERWPGFGDAARRQLAELLDAARARVVEAPAPLLGRDSDPDAIAAARANLARCHPAVARAVRFEEGDVRKLAALDPPGVVLSNPPYGQRLTSADKVMEGFWRHLGQHLRTLDGHTAFLLVAGPDMKRALAMRPTWSQRFMNGPIPIDLARFELGRQTPDSYRR